VTGEVGGGSLLRGGKGGRLVLKDLHVHVFCSEDRIESEYLQDLPLRFNEEQSRAEYETVWTRRRGRRTISTMRQ
jgi:hypothetical protein